VDCLFSDGIGAILILIGVISALTPKQKLQANYIP
jgi:hypothetical protein